MMRTGNGIACTNFSVAVERDFPNKDTGEKEVDFIDCVAWRQTGEFVSKYFQKGSLIVVSGRLQVSTWTDKNNNNRKVANVVASNVYFGGSKKESSSTSTNTNTYSTPNYGGYNPYAAPAAPVSDFALFDDDDAVLPF
jgi:single-strand DNA-binding protein